VPRRGKKCPPLTPKEGDNFSPTEKTFPERTVFFFEKTRENSKEKSLKGPLRGFFPREYPYMHPVGGHKTPSKGFKG